MVTTWRAGRLWGQTETLVGVGGCPIVTRPVQTDPFDEENYVCGRRT